MAENTQKIEERTLNRLQMPEVVQSVPKAVQAVNAKLDAAVRRRFDARRAVIAAEELERGARAHDEQALKEALRDGKPAPEPAEPAKKATAQRARTVAAAARAVEVEVQREREAVMAAEADAWLPKLDAEARQRVERIGELLPALRQQFGEFELITTVMQRVVTAGQRTVAGDVKTGRGFDVEVLRLDNQSPVAVLDALLQLVQGFGPDTSPALRRERAAA